MPEPISKPVSDREVLTLVVNGKAVSVPRQCTVAVAVFLAGEMPLRRSVTGQPRGPLCGMGICFECRVTINGEPHCRSCQMPCQDGMVVRTS